MFHNIPLLWVGRRTISEANLRTLGEVFPGRKIKHELDEPEGSDATREARLIRLSFRNIVVFESLAGRFNGVAAHHQASCNVAWFESVGDSGVMVMRLREMGDPVGKVVWRAEAPVELAERVPENYAMV